MSDTNCLTDCGVASAPARNGTAFGCPRKFLGNRFVYVVISARARGLSIGINMNPDKLCNFDCLYCEVDRNAPPAERALDVSVMAEELNRTIQLIRSGAIRGYCPYNTVNAELLRLRHVAFSGDGEPTLCPQFAEALQEAVHVRAVQSNPFTKLVLITNGTGLQLPNVEEGLRYFTSEDEIWIKLDAGTQDYMNRVNRSPALLDKVIENAIHIGRTRPIVLQSLFPRVDGQDPRPEDVDDYLRRVAEIKAGGAQIKLIQIYSASRPVRHPECTHLPLKALSNIRHRVQAELGLPAEVF